MNDKGQAIFLDRDGVINHQRADYVKRWEEFEFLPGSLDAMRRLARLKWPILVITNQSSIGRGVVTAKAMADIHRCMKEAIAEVGGRIDGVFVCPHHPNEGCMCRKPRSGLLLQAAAAFDLRLTDCCFVGESFTDYLAARAVGCPAVLVESGLQASQLPELLKEVPDVPLLPDLASAVSLIERNFGQKDNP